MTMEKKFEEMDEMIKNYDNMSDEDRWEYFEEEILRFISLRGDEKVENYNKLFINAVMNKHYCIERTKFSLEFYTRLIKLLKKAIINDCDTDSIIKTINMILFVLEKESKEVEEKFSFSVK